MPQGYRDLGIYDAPGVALSQLAGGRFSLENLKNDLVSPERLAPEDRKTMAERLLDQGDGPGAFAVNVLTNPFVLAMLFSYAPAGRALAKGRSPFLPGAGKGAMVNPHNAMAAAGVLGLNDAAMGNHLPAVLAETHQMAKEARDGSFERVGGALGKLMQKMGVGEWDPKVVGKTHGKEAAKRVAAMHAAEDILVHEMWKPYEVRAPRLALEYGYGERGAKKGEWVTRVLGRSDDGSNAAHAFQQQVERLESHQAEVRTLMEERKAGILSEEGRARLKELRDLGEPVRPYVKTKVVVPEKADYTVRFAPEGQEGKLKEYAERVLAESPPEFADYVAARIAEKRGIRDRLFELEGGLPSDRKAKVMLRGVQSRMEGAGHEVEGVLDSPLGSFGQWQGDGAVAGMFGKWHRNAIEMGVQSEQEAMGELKKMIAGGEAMGDRYIPFNTFERVVTPSMKGNPNRRAADLSALKAVEEDGLKGGMGLQPGLVIPKTGKAPVVHPGDWRRWAGAEGMDPEVAKYMEGQAVYGEVQADRLLSEKGLAMPALVMDSRRVTDKYVREAGTYEVLTRPPTQGMLAEQAAVLRNAKEQNKGWEMAYQDPSLEPVTGGGKAPRADQEWWNGSTDEVAHEMTVEGMLRNSMVTIADKNVVKQAREAVGGLMGRGDPQGRITRAAIAQSKRGVESFMGTGLGKWIESNVPKLAQHLNEFADPENEVRDPSSLWRGVARVFYMSHLGLNTGSMAVNLMQPMTMTAPLLGLEPTLKGYGRAMKTMWDYAQKRVGKYGARMISAKERQELLDEVAPRARQWGIGGDHLDTLDAVSFGGRLKGKQGLMEKAEEIFLKGFEKTEWLNRFVSGHAYEAAWEKSGKPLNQAFRDGQARFVGMTQFGNTPENTPQIFLKGWMANPVLRQFMSFPLRTFTGAVYTSPMIGGEGSYLKGLGNSVVRGMGMSAVIYEAGKSLAGVDLTRGLYASGVSDLMGGEKYLEGGNGWVKVPPVLDVPHAFISAIAEGDMGALGGAIARVVPGGVALNRVTGVMPGLGAGVLGEMQKTTADWENPLEDGRVPVYKGGRLVDYKSPTELVMRGLGVDMGRFNEPGSLDGYLVKQREEILAARHEYLRRLTGNDPGGAQKVAAAFQDKIGLPLTVTQAQVKAFVQSRNVPRTERILDRLPGDVRAAYGGIVQGARGLNVPRGTLTQGGTSTSRRGAREVVDEGLEGRIRAAMEQELKGAKGPGSGLEFGGFGS